MGRAIAIQFQSIGTIGLAKSRKLGLTWVPNAQKITAEALSFFDVGLIENLKLGPQRSPSCV